MAIVRSLLDTDFYKFTMGQVIFKRYPQVPVKFVFKNRTKGIRLADHIDKNFNHGKIKHLQEVFLIKILKIPF